MFEFLNGISLGRAFLAFRGAILFVDLALFAAFVFAFLKALEYRPKFVRNPRAERRSPLHGDPAIRERWLQILESADTQPPQSYALAIIEADKLTDQVLVQLGYQGEHMADRLERLQTSGISALDELWRAHRLRNELVHTPDFEISEHETRQALHSYQRFLSELGVLT